MSENTRNLIKSFCKYIYYAGIGNYWYENIFQETVRYKLYSIICFTFYVIMILLENLAAVFGTFPEVEKNSAVMFAAIHNIVLTKMFLLIYHKKSIRKLNYEMASVGAKLEEKYVMKQQYDKVKYGLTMYAVSVYLSLLCYGAESFRKLTVEGTPFYTVVTYLPTYEDESTIASVLRVIFYIIWLYMMLPMMSADCLPIVHLIIMRYKFVTLCHHYERMREDLNLNIRINKMAAIEHLKREYLQGIVMHQKLINLADELRRVFGVIMSLQVCESSAVAVLLLLRLALTPNINMSNAIMTYTFVGSLFFLLALNLWNAGEITYQASLLSNAMFYSGWHLCELQKRPHNDIRQLVLISCAQAQKPLILKAFGIQDLSYETFVSVARMTYSIFAVFYKRGET